MGDSLFEFVRALANLRYAETWVTRRGGFLFAAIIGLFAWLFVYEATDISRRWQIAAGVCGFAVGWFLWLTVREIYWRTGGGVKVGVCYEGHRVPFEDWIRTREELRRLSREHEVGERIRIRLLPADVTETEARWTRIERRYGFSLLLKIDVSALLDKPERTDMRCAIRHSIKAAVQREFVDAALRHTQALFARKIDAKTVKDLLRYRASSLFEGVLLNLGAIHYAEKRFSEASELLHALDRRLSERYAEDQNPRRAVRWLDSQCLMSSSDYAGDTPPEADALTEVVVQSTTAAERYGDQFPYVLLNHARNLYYLGELDSALAAAKRVRALRLDAGDSVHADLNLAVLNLFATYWDQAASKFQDFLDACPRDEFDWNDVIRFADFARSYGHEPAVFMQVMYRSVARVDVPADMDRELSDWLNADTSRSALKRLRDRQWAKTKALAVTTAAKPNRRSR